MRRTTVIAAATVILLSLPLFVPGPAFAVGNVLVPTDDTDTSLPNFSGSPSDNGSTDTLLPSTPNTLTIPSHPSTLNTTPSTLDNAAAPDALAKIFALPASTDPKLAHPSAVDQLGTTQDALKSITAAEQVRPMSPSDILYSPVSDADAAKLPSGVVRTIVVRSPDISPILLQAGQKLPYSLTFAIGSNSVFGAKDVKSIQDKLGLSRDAIAKACILTLNGMMKTDKGTYLIMGAPSPQTTVKYDGTILNYTMVGMAKCAVSGPLPQGSGFLRLVGDRFNVSLSAVNCAPPTRQASLLTVTYDGTETPRCDYQ